MADISGLNVQFGALDFGSEAGSGTVDMAQGESAREQAPAPAPVAPAPMSVPTAVPTQQPQNSLFSKPGSVRCVCVRIYVRRAFMKPVLILPVSTAILIMLFVYFIY